MIIVCLAYDTPLLEIKMKKWKMFLALLLVVPAVGCFEPLKAKAPLVAAQNSEAGDDCEFDGTNVSLEGGLYVLFVPCGSEGPGVLQSVWLYLLPGHDLPSVAVGAGPGWGWPKPGFSYTAHAQPGWVGEGGGWIEYRLEDPPQGSLPLFCTETTLIKISIGVDQAQAPLNLGRSNVFSCDSRLFEFDSGNMGISLAVDLEFTPSG